MVSVSRKESFAIWLFGRATWRIRPRRVVPRGGRASRLDASRYRTGEPPNEGKISRAYHVLHDHLGGEVFLDGGGRHRDKGAAFENPREESGQRVIRDSDQPPSRTSQSVRGRRARKRARARVRTTARRTLRANARACGGLCVRGLSARGRNGDLGSREKKGSRTVGVSEPQNLSLSRDRC